MSARDKRALTGGMQYEFQTVLLGRSLSRSVVTKLLVERAEHGGWELDRLRIGHDGVRRVKLRRKIIKQQREDYLWL